MSFTPLEKSKIISYLGLPARIIMSNSADYSSAIARRLDSLDESFEELGRQLIVRLDNIEERLGDALNRVHTSQVSDIKLRDDEMRQLKIERKRLCLRLSDMLDIPFAASGGGISIRI